MSPSTDTVDPGTMEVVRTDELLVPYEDDDDPNVHTHIVRPGDNGHGGADDPMTAQDVVDQARMLGIEVVALCGHRWVPKRNPEKYPPCGACFEMAGLIDRGEMR